MINNPEYFVFDKDDGYYTKVTRTDDQEGNVLLEVISTVTGKARSSLLIEAHGGGAVATDIHKDRPPTVVNLPDGMIYELAYALLVEMKSGERNFGQMTVFEGKELK